LLVCVVDNRGGRIFDGLPVAKVASNLAPWTTPHEHDLAAVARALGLPTWSVGTQRELSLALAERPIHGPAVVVCNVDPIGAQRVYSHLREGAVREFEP
jgi:2-succinyl-5-enolpyruvyl-6-hydroxy-3-cyclohexene-1-carboxylate synthase